MTNLYSMLKTNTDETLNSKQSTKKIDILFDLETNKQTVLDTEFDKNIVCVCGSCDLLLENNGEKESLTLNDHKITVHFYNIKHFKYTLKQKNIKDFIKKIKRYFIPRFILDIFDIPRNLSRFLRKNIKKMRGINEFD